MTYILGCDVSTACTGVALIKEDDQSYILDKIQFKKCNTIWDKIDVVKDYFENLVKNYSITQIYVEEALIGFSSGGSSPQTIATLLKFNGQVCYIIRELIKQDPVYINAAHARKVCGIKLQAVKKIGKSHKDQVFEHMIANDLKNYNWQMTRTGKYIPESKDMCDAYVIAKAGLIENNAVLNG